jgi:hypothetical protein
MRLGKPADAASWLAADAPNLVARIKSLQIYCQSRALPLALRLVD